MAPERAPIGMLAGGGRLPIEIAESILGRGGRVHAVLIGGEADQDWSAIPHTEVGWGSIGGMVGALKDAGCRDLVIIGRVRRPDLWKLRPDFGFWQALPRIVRLVRAGGDDSVLRRVVRFFEDQGFQVRGPGDLVPELVVGAGPLGACAVPAGMDRDIALGFEVIAALGDLDIGQAVVVADGRLAAVEGAEGTDGLMMRLSGQAGTRRAVLVKAPKPGQELRVDMPVIGSRTLGLAEAKGFAGIAVAAGSVLVADRAEAVRAADAAGLFVMGAEVAERPAAGSGRERAWQVSEHQRLGQRRPTAAEVRDAARGWTAVARLARFSARASAFVARRHILAVGIGETPAEIVARLRTLRQWGDRARWGRRGVLAFADANALDEASIQAAAAAGLAGIVLGDRPANLVALAGAVDRARLFLLAISPSDRRGEP